MCLAIPGQIVEVSSEGGELARVARVRFGPLVKDVNVSLVPEAGAGDWVLVHVGVAIQRIDPDEAARVLEAVSAALGEEEPA